MKNVVIVGGGFAGLNAAKKLGNKPDIKVTLIDRENYHTFQPLLYQVAMAGLSTTDIATPIRIILSKYENITVLKERLIAVDPDNKTITTDTETMPYDTLVLSMGMKSNYFGHNEWANYAPSLKTIPDALEMRHKFLSAFEKAECCRDKEEQKRLLSFVVIGGGPTGVELAGAIGEMTQSTIRKDFRNIDLESVRITLVESKPQILTGFDKKLAQKALTDLNNLKVDVITGCRVTHIDEQGVAIGDKKIPSATVLWGAGVQAISFDSKGKITPVGGGRIKVNNKLRLDDYPDIFVAGDLASVVDKSGAPLPGTAPVAIQAGHYIAKEIIAQVKGKPATEFKYLDKGRLATIGRSHAIVQMGPIKLTGWIAWIFWLFIHILYLVGFKNRLFVMMNWTWNWFTFSRGARLIIDRFQHGSISEKKDN